MRIRRKTRSAIARVVLILGMLGPGLFLSIRPSYFTTSAIFHSSLNISLPGMYVLGVILVVASIFALFEKFRDFAYSVGAVFYGLTLLAYIIGFFSGEKIGALVLAIPVLVWAYFEATLTSTGNLPLNQQPPKTVAANTEWRKDQG